MKKLSGVIITYNEERKVQTALESLRPVCDEIVVVDSFSTDRTPELCRALCDTFLQTEWRGYAAQKQFAADQSSEQWVLSLDADERLSDSLTRELLDWKASRHADHSGYHIPRITWFMGRWIRHTTWYPDWQLRLFRRDVGKWTGGRVHEGIEVPGSTGRFEGHIQHYTYESISEYLRQLETFSSLAAVDSLEKGKTTSVARVCLYPGIIFLKNYFVKRGFLDGFPGLVVSVLAAVSSFFKQLKLYELSVTSTPGNRWTGSPSKGSAPTSSPPKP